MFRRTCPVVDWTGSSQDLEPGTVGNGDSCWSTCQGQCPNDVLKPGLAFDFDEIRPGHPGCTSHFECVGNFDRVLCHGVRALDDHIPENFSAAVRQLEDQVPVVLALTLPRLQGGTHRSRVGKSRARGLEFLMQFQVARKVVMGKPGLKAQTALHRTPTPSRSLFSLLDQSRSAAGVDEPTSSRSIPTEATEVSPTEVEAQAAQDRLTTGREACHPSQKTRKTKEAEGPSSELKPSEAKKIVQALAEATPGSKVRKVHHMVAAPEDTRVIAEELRTAVIAAEEFRPGTEGRSGHPRRSRFPVLEAWRNERVIYERRPGSAMPQITACEFVKEEILEGGKADCTLETLGEALFTSPELSESGVFFFSAHPKRDASSGELFNIGITLGMPLSLEVYCCSAAGELRQRSKVPLKELTFVHDFAITEKYIVLILPPWVCPVEGVLQSLWEGGLGSKFQWQEDLGTRCVLLRRSDLSTVFDETLKPPVSLYHTVNAFDQGEAVVLQVAAHNGSREEVERNFQDMYRSTWTDETRCCLKELVLDISAGQISVSSVGPAEAASFELPTIHPAFVGRKHRHVFTNSAFPSTAGFANSIERLDLEKNLLDRARFDAGQFAGEPMILPKTGPQEELNAKLGADTLKSLKHSGISA
eukprot:g30142.t1